MNEHLELPVGELETVATVEHNATVQVRFKGQRPDDKCLLELTVNTDFLKAIHAAKERGGSVWVRFEVAYSKSLLDPHLVVRDILE